MDKIGSKTAPDRAAALLRRGGPFRRLYREEARAWREGYRKSFRCAARALGLGFVAGFTFFMLWPTQEKRALAFVVQALKDIPLDAGPALMALTLFYHNTRASVVAVAAGAVPFLFLPIVDPFINGAVLGLLVSVGQHQGLNVPRLLLTQILPHGVFELTAVLYATSLGLYLSAAMGKKAAAAWKRRWGTRPRGTCPRPVPPSATGMAPEMAPPNAPGQERESVPPCEAGLFRDLVRSFALVVLPLLLIAALIEAFITPHLR